MGCGASAPLKSEGPVEYTIRVTTGKGSRLNNMDQRSKEKAGTDSNVYIQLIGNDGRKAFDVNVKKGAFLDNKFKDDFEEGNTDVFKVNGENVGDIVMVELHKDEIGTSWMCCKVEVEVPSDYAASKQCYNFPCHRWVDQVEKIVEGSVSRCPHHEDNNICKKHRQLQTEKSRGIYQLDVSPDHDIAPWIVGLYNELPVNEQWHGDKAKDFFESRDEMVRNFALEALMSAVTRWEGIDGYKEVFKTVKTPDIAEKWREDEEFGRQRTHYSSLCAFNVVQEAIPPQFGVEEAELSQFIAPSPPLQEQIDSGRFLYIDYTSLDGLETQDKRYACAPMCLLYLNDQGNVVPIAIRLHQSPDKSSNPVYFPNDPSPAWVYAKMVFNSMDFIHFQLAMHYNRCHLNTEGFIISLNRQLSDCHPIHKLLKPHTKFQLGINTLARSSLVCEGGLIHETVSLSYPSMVEVLKRDYKAFTWQDWVLPNTLKERGLNGENAKALKYHYAEDGLDLWGAIRRHVERVTGIFYKTEEELKSDTELGAFFGELHSSYGGDRFPKEVPSWDNFVDILSGFIYQVAVQHAVMNFQQYESSAFIPAAPLCIWSPIPGADGALVDKSTITEDKILESLPAKNFTTTQVVNVYLLSQYSTTEELLGVWLEERFMDEEVKSAHAEFVKDLEGIEKRIGTRGWTHMAPSAIPNSTSV